MSTLPVSLYSADAPTTLTPSGAWSRAGSTAGRTTALGPDAASDTPREHKLRQAAQQFESMLMSNLWKSMKSSFDEDDSDSSDPAMGTMQDWAMEAMSSAVGTAGGLGIARLIMKDLQPKIDPPQTEREVPKG